MNSITIKDALSRFDECWSPRILADVNGQHIKLAKLSGGFHWHAHSDADEMFLVVEGVLDMEFRDKTVELKEGDMLVVPRGVEHRPVAKPECSVLLVETAGVVNTGDGDETEQSTSGTWLD